MRKRGYLWFRTFLAICSLKKISPSELDQIESHQFLHPNICKAPNILALSGQIYAAHIFARKKFNICTCMLRMLVWLFCTSCTGFLHMQVAKPGRSHIFEEEVECNFLLPCKSAITYHFVNKSNKILHTFIQIFLHTFLQIFVHTIVYTFYMFTFYKQVVLQFVLHFNKFSHAGMHICNHSQFCITTSVSL